MLTTPAMKEATISPNKSFVTPLTRTCCKGGSAFATPFSSYNACAIVGMCVTLCGGATVAHGALAPDAFVVLGCGAAVTLTVGATVAHGEFALGAVVVL